MRALQKRDEVLDVDRYIFKDLDLNYGDTRLQQYNMSYFYNNCQIMQQEKK